MNTLIRRASTLKKTSSRCGVSCWQTFSLSSQKRFTTDNWHSHRHKMCLSAKPTYEAEFIQFLLSAGKKRLESQFNFTYRYIDGVLSINNPDVENYLGQMYPPELEIKDTTESNTSAFYLDLLLSIGRDSQICTSFTTSVTISMSLLQTVRSWVATSHLRPPMVVLSHNSFDMPGPAPLMTVLFWVQCDFQ